MLCFSSTLQAQNQTYGYEKVSTEVERVEKGLSQNSIRCMVQDQLGFIWYGTWAGLNRYDGQHFVVLGADIENPETALNSSVINALAIDSSDYLWVGTESGLNRLNVRSLEIENFSNVSIHPRLKDTIFSLLYLKNKLWVGTQKGLLMLTTDSLKAQYFILNEGGKEPQIRTIHQLDSHRLLLGTDRGVWEYDFNEFRLLRRLCYPIIQSDFINALQKDDHNHWFVGTEKGLDYLDLSNESSVIINHKDNSSRQSLFIVMDIMKDRDSNVWVATSGKGVKLLQALQGADKPYSYQRISALPMHTEKFPGRMSDEDYYYSLMQSRDGTIWLGSAWSGAFKLVKETNIFQKFQRSEATRGLTDNHIWAFLDDGNELWIGTERGVNIYNRKSHKIRSLQYPKLSSDKIRSLFKDSQGNFWIGTYKSGLNKYDPKVDQVEFYSPDSSLSHFIASNTVWQIIEDDEKNLWFATHNGLQRTNLISGETKVFQHNPNDSNSLSSDVVYSIYMDRQGRLWAVTFNGLNLFLPEKNGFKVFKSQTGDPHSLNTNRLFAIYQDTAMNYWVATIGGGLNKMDPTTGEVQHYTTAHGLSDNTIYAIIPDDFGNIWLPTNYGVSAFNIANESFVNYSVDDGLTSNEFNKGAAMKDRFGNLYFGGMFGFNVLKPKKIRTNHFVPELVVSEFKIDNQLISYALRHGEAIELNYQQKNLFFRFSMLDFVNPSKAIYKYRIRNLDNNWKTLSSRYPVLNINKLNPGYYIIEVNAMNSAGVWTDKPMQIKIYVRDAWYNLLHVRLIAIFILILTLYLVLHRRIKRIRLKHQTERQLLDLEKQTLRLQMNPHFIFNTLNSIQNFILKNDTDQSISYLSKFSRLMRMMLNYSREQFITLDEEIRLIKSYLEIESLRLEKSFEWTINTQAGMDLEEIQFPPMIIQPFVENAIIHGLLPLKERQGELVLNFTMEDQVLCVRIKDNGVGRKKGEKEKDKHRPSGMLITQRRLELINKLPTSDAFYEVKDLKDSLGNPAGTEVRLRIQIDA